jgi:hypothetical protein
MGVVYRAEDVRLEDGHLFLAMSFYERDAIVPRARRRNTAVAERTAGRWDRDR